MEWKEVPAGKVLMIGSRCVGSVYKVKDYYVPYCNLPGSSVISQSIIERFAMNRVEVEVARWLKYSGLAPTVNDCAVSKSEVVLRAELAEAKARIKRLEAASKFQLFLIGITSKLCDNLQAELDQSREDWQADLRNEAENAG